MHARSVIKGQKGFPTQYIDPDKGARYVEDTDLRNLLSEQLLPELIRWSRSPWMAIASGNVSMSLMMATRIVADLTTDYWDAPLEKLLNLGDELWQELEDFDISILKMLGLLPAYRAIHTEKPHLVSDKLRGFLENQHAH